MALWVHMLDGECFLSPFESRQEARHIAKAPVFTYHFYVRLHGIPSTLQKRLGIVLAVKLPDEARMVSAHVSYYFNAPLYWASPNTSEYRVKVPCRMQTATKNHGNALWRMFLNANMKYYPILSFVPFYFRILVASAMYDISFMELILWKNGLNPNSANFAWEANMQHILEKPEKVRPCMHSISLEQNLVNSKFKQP